MTKTFRAGMTFLVAVLGMAGSARAVEIAGVVVDEAGKPLADAKIVVQEVDLLSTEFLNKTLLQQKGEIKSDLNGKFSITLPDAKINAWGLRITAIHPHYGLVSLSAQELFLKGKTLSECRFIMPPGGFIQGKAVDSAGKPVKDAEITVILTKKTGHGLSRPDKSLLSTKTDADGTFKLDGLPRDVTVIVYAEHPDYSIGTAGLPKGQPSLMGAITVGSTDTIIKLQPGATVEGKITWEGSGTPAGHMPVIAVSENKKPILPEIMDLVMTDENGVFSIKSLAPGKYVLRGPPTYMEGSIVPRVVEIATTSKINGQDLTVTKGVRISGKFENTDTKEPVEGGRILVQSINGPLYNVWLDAKSDGTFERRLLPGEVTLHPSIRKGTLTQEERTLTLIAGKDRTNLVFEVKPPLIFKGRVLDPEGKPMAGATVFSRSQTSESPVISNQEGLFEFPISTTNHGHSVLSPVIFEASYSGRSELRGMLEKYPISESDLKGDIKLVPAGAIQGKITWEGTGAPVANTLVEAKFEEGDQIDAFKVSEQTVTDESGSFSFKDLMPNKYTLRVNSFKEGCILPRKIEVAQASTLTDQNLIACKGVRIAGKFVNADTKEPFDNGWLSVHSKNDPNSARTIQAKSDGTFECRMPPGVVTLEASTLKDGYVPWEKSKRTIRLVAGKDQKDLVFEVKPALVFKGRSLGPDGKPIAGANIFLKQWGDEETGNIPIVSNKEGFFELVLPSRMNFERSSAIPFYVEASHPEKPGLRGVLSKDITSPTDLTEDIPLIPTGTIQGKVTWEETGISLKDVVVKASLSSDMQCHAFRSIFQAETDETGNFLLKDMMPGEYRIDVELPMDGVSYSRTVEVTSGGNATNQDLIVFKGVRLAGKFINAATKEPVKEGRVYFKQNNSPWSAWAFGIRSDGTFECRMPPGEVSMEASVRSGRLTSEQAKRKLMLVDGQDQTDLVVEVKPLLTFKGRVLGLDGKPIGGAKVYSKQGDLSRPAISNQEGLFELVLSSYILFEDGSPISFNFDAIHPDEPELRGVLKKEIASEVDLTGDIVMSLTGTIEGKVALDGAGTPIGDLVVLAIPEKKEILDSVCVSCCSETDDAGLFQIKKLMPGKYTLKVYSYKEGDISSRNVEVTPGAKITDQNLVATKWVRVAGKFVKADTKEPISGGSVRVCSVASKKEQFIFPKSDGTFEGYIEPGEVTLKADRLEDFRSPDLAQKKLSLVAGQDQTNIIFEVDPPLIFRGRVLGVDGKPQAGVNVVYRATATTVISDQDGLFELSLPRHVRFWNGAEYSISLDAQQPGSPGLRGLMTKKLTNESDLKGDIMLIPTGSIQGKIAWEGTGTPVPLLSVWAIPDESTQKLIAKDPGRVDADESGSFTIKNLMPGKYTLRTTAYREGVVLHREIEVDQGAKMTGQDLIAIKGVRIAGRFVKAGTKEPVNTGRLSASMVNYPDYETSFIVKSDGTFEGRMAPGNVMLQANIENGILPKEQEQRILTLVPGQDQTDLVYEVFDKK